MEQQASDMWTQRAILGAVIVLVFRIVWDWLKNRKAEPAEPVKSQCEDQSSCGTVHDLRENQIRVEENIKDINTKLDKGDEKFDTMQVSVGQIEKDVAVVVAIMRERHSTGGELFQSKK